MFANKVQVMCSLAGHEPRSPKWQSKIRTIHPTQLASCLEIFPLSIIPPDFLRVLWQKIPHIITQNVLRQNNTFHVHRWRPNVQSRAKPFPSGWNTKILVSLPCNYCYRRVQSKNTENTHLHKLKLQAVALLNQPSSIQQTILTNCTTATTVKHMLPRY